MISRLDYDDIKFIVSKKDYVKIEKKNSICVNVFCYENGLLYPVHVSDKKSKYCLDLSLMLIVSRMLIGLCVKRQKIKTKNTSSGIVFSVLVAKES